MRKDFIKIEDQNLKDYSKCMGLVQGILNDKGKCGDWVKRYNDHCKKLKDKEKSFMVFIKKFNEWKPFTCNTTISSIEDKIIVDLRYNGQTVAIIKPKKDEIVISTPKKIYNTNIKYFGCDIKLNDDSWSKSEKAKSFRTFFKELPRRKNTDGKGNDEHRIESLLIDYLDGKKKNSKGKKLIPGLVQIKFNKIRFAINTPISASKNEIKGCINAGGGIDILARFRNDLTIIEVKDENTMKEPTQKVMKQAIAYATFIRELLRAEQEKNRDNTWWKLFGYDRKLPEQLHLNVAVAMPFADEADKKNNGNNVDFNLEKIYLDDDKKEKGDFLELHYIYFKEKDNIIEIVETSLKPRNCKC